MRWERAEAMFPAPSRAQLKPEQIAAASTPINRCPSSFFYLAPFFIIVEDSFCPVLPVSHPGSIVSDRKNIATKRVTKPISKDPRT